MFQLTPEQKQSALEEIKGQIGNNPIFLYMKGTPAFPQCGFSSRVVQILNSLNIPFNACNVLENPAIRATLPEYANWPTFPQLYVDGELIGGCDIVAEMYESGELQQLFANRQSA